MAVDFSQLPQEEESQIKPPSRLVWTIAFVVMVLSGALAVLLLWPKDMHTQTWTFWASLVLFPIGIPTWIVLRRFSVFEGRKLDADLHNEAVLAFNNRVFEAASIPLVVLGNAHRISSEALDNSAERIQAGALTLEAQDSPAKQGQVTKARWLKVAGMPNQPGKKYDALRCRYVTAWLFDQLIDDLLPHIRALPARVPIVLELSMSNGLSQEENNHQWETCWYKKTSRYVEIKEPPEAPAGLMMLDQWMDSLLQSKDQHIALVVVIQLYPLLCVTLPDGVAEAGIALLLAPEALACKYDMPRVCHLHRPVQSTIDEPGEAVGGALRWAGTAVKPMITLWNTGWDTAKDVSLIEVAKKRMLNLHPVDLDQSIGHAGIAAPWLATSLAASSISSKATEQMVLEGHGKYIDVLVVKSCTDLTKAA